MSSNRSLLLLGLLLIPFTLLFGSILIILLLPITSMHDDIPIRFICLNTPLLWCIVSYFYFDEKLKKKEGYINYKKIIYYSNVKGHEGKCKTVWLNRNYICFRFSNVLGITGFFKNIKDIWIFKNIKYGKEFHGYISNITGKIESTEGIY